MRADDLAGAPPRLASALIEVRLPGEIADAISGDLEHEYRTRLRPAHSKVVSDAWFWAQALSLRVGALRRSSNRLRDVQPTWERNRPGTAGNSDPDFWSNFPMQFNDLKYAVRRLLRSPGFTAVAVLSLALGIGANTAMFSLVNAVLIRDLPVTAPEQLVEVYTSDSDGFVYATSSTPDFLDLREETTAFQSVIGSRTFISRMDQDGTPKIIFGELISWDYFQTLGVPMAFGRPFQEEEDRTPGTHPVVILGYQTWVQDFASNPDVIGTSVRLNSRPYTVVGIAPEAFTGSMPVLVSGFFAPLMMTDEIMGVNQLERRSSRSMFLKARMKPGVTVEQANADLARVAASLEERYPETNENRVMSAIASGDIALHPMVDKMLTPVAGLLLAVVGLVLLIACANLASFLLARAEDRRKEIAVRLALGAGRSALIRQLLIETTLLAVLGGLAGLVLANWTVGLLMAFQPPLPIPVSFDISLDRTVLFFTGGVSILAGLAFGLIPALQATNPDIAPTLKNEAVGSASGRRLNLRGALVVTQVAFSFVLLIGAGLFVRSMQKAQLIDPGFDTGPAALVWPMPEFSGYDTPEAVQQFQFAYEERLLAHPMVTAVAQADRLPLGIGIQTNGYLIPGMPSESQDGDHDIDMANIWPGYFNAMGVEIVSGQPFAAADRAGDAVVVVSEAFVDRYFPGQDVVGQVFQRGGGTDLRIIGVAADTKVRTLGEPPRPYVYHLAGQGAPFGLMVVVRGEGTSAELVAIARETLVEVAPNMALFEDPKTMNDHLSLLLFPPRMAALLLSVFGGLALLLSAIGIYGVVSYSVAKRTRELGIRMSLGATAKDVVGMAIGGGMRLVVVGGVVGIALAAAVTWSISKFLYGIAPTDVATFVTIPVILAGVALLAAYVPARRASSVDPVGALRSE
jgi:putative ABC transport system permease protein